MKKTNRRSFLQKGATAAAAAAAGVVGAKAVRGQAQAGAPSKKAAAELAQTPPTTTAGFEQWSKKANQTTGLFNGRVAYGPLLFISGIGHHEGNDIRVHTKSVLDQIQSRLEAAGSSMDKVVKCNVYLNDLKDYAAMNEMFRGRFGEAPPVRTTVACAGGIPGDSLVEIDVIAYI
jgi:enamine deaminase RidA (YjgF/YER057c/UK114 family)